MQPLQRERTFIEMVYEILDPKPNRKKEQDEKIERVRKSACCDSLCVLKEAEEPQWSQGK